MAIGFLRFSHYVRFVLLLGIMSPTALSFVGRMVYRGEKEPIPNYSTKFTMSRVKSNHSRGLWVKATTPIRKKYNRMISQITPVMKLSIAVLRFT